MPMGGGGGGNQQNWQGSAPQQMSLAKTAFSFCSFVFESSKKSTPKLMPISLEHTPPYSNFVSNVDNHAWHNGLGSEPMYLHQKARNMTAALAVMAPAAL